MYLMKLVVDVSCPMCLDVVADVFDVAGSRCE